METPKTGRKEGFAMHLLLVVISILQGGDIEKDINKKFSVKLTSTDEASRREAYFYAIKNIIGFKRTTYAPYLLHIINTNYMPQGTVLANEEAERSPRRIALSIISEWSDPDLLPVLSKYIVYYAPDQQISPTTTLFSGDLHENYAAIKGMINIGKPAIAHCFGEMIKADADVALIPDDHGPPKTMEKMMRQRQLHLGYVIWMIAGKAEAIKLFEQEIEKAGATSPVAAGKLRAALTRIKAQGVK